MQRSFVKKLENWKNSEHRKPLIVSGARQVGKTWCLTEFGKTQFKNFTYLNCDLNPQVKELFNQDHDINRLLRGIESLSGEKIVPESTLIFLDEVQEIPQVLPALKYFYEDAPEIFIAVSGSLLGFKLHEGTSFPVGKVNELVLYPMTFSEFVLEIAGEKMYKALIESPFEELNGLHSTFVELLRQYYFTGGMPEAVLAYSEKRALQDVREIQKQILADYERDISKHAPANQIARIHQVWNSIPQQLAKENSKFFYGDIQKGSRAKDFEIAIQWLSDAGIIHKVPRVREANIPLKFYEDFGAFKLFLNDCGLMGAMTEAPISEILIGDNIFKEYKGAFTEQFVLQQFVATQENSIFYYSAEASKQELDFLIQKENRLLPIEVKAEENLRAKSLRQFCIDHEGTRGLRLSMAPYREQDWLTNQALFTAERV